MRIIGILLIVLGVIGLVYGGISWTNREEVADLGPVEVTSQERESLPISPIVGGVFLVVGAALLVAGGRSRSAVRG
jgi:uncharacterized membrane protein YidH (DUF202 family)